MSGAEDNCFVASAIAGQFEAAAHGLRGRGAFTGSKSTGVETGRNTIVVPGHGDQMTMLRISLFGGVRVVHEGVPNATVPTRGVQTLLAYLLLQRRRAHTRESLVGTFWGDCDEEAARNCLNTTLWRLRRVLEPPGIPRGRYLITSSSGDVSFNDQGAFWLDTEELERHAGAVVNAHKGAPKESDIIQLENAVQLYTGDILDGVYDDWALRERERLRAVYLQSRTCLMRYYASHGEAERGIDHAEAILHLDPLREEVHRELIRMHLALGSRARAAKQYDTCKSLLAKELDVEPMPETRSLLAAITGRPGALERSAAGAATDIDALALELRGATQTVERALAYLRDVAGRVEHALMCGRAPDESPVVRRGVRSR